MNTVEYSIFSNIVEGLRRRVLTHEYRCYKFEDWSRSWNLALFLFLFIRINGKKCITCRDIFLFVANDIQVEMARDTITTAIAKTATANNATTK